MVTLAVMVLWSGCLVYKNTWEEKKRYASSYDQPSVINAHMSIEITVVVISFCAVNEHLSK